MLSGFCVVFVLRVGVRAWLVGSSPVCSSAVWMPGRPIPSNTHGEGLTTIEGTSDVDDEGG